MLPLGARLSRGTHSGIAFPVASHDKSRSSSSGPLRGASSKSRLAIARRSKSPFSTSTSTFLTSSARRTLMTAASKKPVTDVWAFDFDGVVCDSVGESAISAWEASAELWPDLFSDPAVLARKEEILHKMRLVRPVVETGYENLVQVRCLLEDAPGTEAADSSVERMLRSWSAEMLPRAMERWGLRRSELVERFGAYRDEWMRRDLRSWLESNGFYPGVAEAVAAARDGRGCSGSGSGSGRSEAYIVTTKQARFALALLREIGKIPFEEDRVFSQTVSGQPKSEVLKMLEERHGKEGEGGNSVSFHFVEDKLSTLEKVAADETMKRWKLYLVDWGYNTEEERERARRNKRIEVVGVERFREMILK